MTPSSTGNVASSSVVLSTTPGSCRSFGLAGLEHANGIERVWTGSIAARIVIRTIQQTYRGEVGGSLRGHERGAELEQAGMEEICFEDGNSLDAHAAVVNRGAALPVLPERIFAPG